MTAKGQPLLAPGLGQGARVGPAILGLDAHGDFTDGVNTLGHRAHSVLQQGIGHLHDRINGLENSVHGAGAHGSAYLQVAVRAYQAHRRRGQAHGAAGHLQAVQPVDLPRLVALVGHQGFQIGVADGFLLVGHFFEAGKDAVELVAIDDLEA